MTSGLGRGRALLGAAAAATLLADQATKAAAMGLLEGRGRVQVAGPLGFRLVHNPGGAFGILQGAPLFFFAASVIVVVLVLRWGWTSGEHPVALGVVAGGGLGNLVDRLVRAPGPLRGRVVDFIDLGFWPTFNLADSAIVAGAVLLLAAGMRGGGAGAARSGESGGEGGTAA